MAEKKQNWRIGALAFFCTFSLMLNLEKTQVLSISNTASCLIENLINGLEGSVITSICVFICMVILFYRESRILSRKMLGDRILACLFSVATLLGRSYAISNSWSYIFGSGSQFLFAMLLMLGYAMFYYAVIGVLFDYLDLESKVSYQENITENFLKSKYFWKVFFFILICWIPYLMIFFPGSVPHDGYYQLNMAYGYNEASNHHPWLSTLVIGVITSIGRNISDNIGVFLYILVQTIFCGFSFSLVCYKIKRYDISNWIKKISVIFFAIVPIWGAYAQTLMKDVLYYGMFAVFYILYLEIIEKRRFLELSKTTIFVIVSCLLVQYRNEGIYIIIFSIVALLAVVEIKKYQVLFASGVILICHMIFSAIVLPAMGVQPGSKREMLTVPFQQTARYVANYEEEVTEKEKQIIDQVLNYGSIKERYNPINSDPIKNSFKNVGKEEFLEYVKVWFNQFRKHPGCYIQATLNNCFGYWYPEYVQDSISNLQFYIKGEPIATGDLDIYYLNHVEIRTLLSQYSLLWFEIPGVSWLMYPGSYTWILCFCLFALMRKKLYKACVAGIPLLLTVAICLISPVNGYVRYALPIMAVMPLMISFTLSQYRQRE